MSENLRKSGFGGEKRLCWLDDSGEEEREGSRAEMEWDFLGGTTAQTGAKNSLLWGTPDATCSGEKQGNPTARQKKALAGHLNCSMGAMGDKSII